MPAGCDGRHDSHREVLLCIHDALQHVVTHAQFLQGIHRGLLPLRVVRTCVGGCLWPWRSTSWQHTPGRCSWPRAIPLQSLWGNPDAIPVGQSRSFQAVQSRSSPWAQSRQAHYNPGRALPEFPMGAIPSAHITIPVGHSRSSPWAQSRQPTCNPGRAIPEFPMGAIPAAPVQSR